MKKLLFIAFAVVGMLAFSSCKKEDSDKEKGKKAAKTVCDCYKKATTVAEFEVCEEKEPDITKVNSDFLAGYIEVILKCDFDFDFDDDDDFEFELAN